MYLVLTIILIVIFGYTSNCLNWRFLNYKITRYLYRVGAIVHESSHALLCLVTSARITEFSIFSDQPHVTHTKSKLPLIGNTLISSAPIFGGLLFLYIINQYVLGSQFDVQNLTNLSEIPAALLNFFASINLLHWQTWVLLLLFINVGAMLGPSREDLKHMWLGLIILLLIPFSPLLSLCITALSFILAGIIIQLVVIGCVRVVKLF